MANISRNQFDLDKGVQRKIHQKGSLLMDADLNEQAQVDLERHRRLLSRLINGRDTGFSNSPANDNFGFMIGSDANALTVNVHMGDAAFHLDANHAVLVTHESSELTGFASWVAGGVSRTDIVYIDIEEKEISPEDDPNIVNPAAGAETCRDIRLEYTVRIASDTSSVPTAPAGHVYRGLAKISKDGSSDQILAGDIELLLPVFSAVAAIESMEVPLWMEASVSHANFDAQGLENDAFTYIIDDLVDSKTISVIKVPYIYDSAHNYIALRCQAKRATWTTGYVRIDGLGQTGWLGTIGPSGASETLEDVFSYLSIPPGLNEGQVYEIQVVLSANSTIGVCEIWMNRPVIVAGLGTDPSILFGV